MRILYIEPDLEKARSIYSQLLSYKGMHWQLQHCSTAEEAAQQEIHEPYDVILVSLRGDESLEGHFQELMERSESIPTVAMLPSTESDSALQWLRVGFVDVVQTTSLNGELLMRRLRMAIARFHRLQRDVKAVNLRPALRIAALQTVGGPSDSADSSECSEFEKPSFDMVRLERFRSEEDFLRVALLKDRNSPRILDDCCDQRLHVEVFRDLDSYLEHFSKDPTQVDCVIVEQDLLERDGLASLSRKELRFPAPPMILLTPERSDANAVSFVESGFDDCLLTSTLTNSNLLRTVSFADARHERLRNKTRDAWMESQSSLDKNVNDRRSAARGSDRRQTPRYLVTRPLLAIPVLPDGSPDRNGICEAFSIDFAVGGIGLQIPNQGTIPSRNWVVGVECSCDDGRGVRFHYANVLLRNVFYPQGGVRMGTKFQPPDADLFRSANFQPALDASTGRMQHGLSEHALQQWVEIGVLQRRLQHRVHVCPECRGIAAMGTGCHDCGSPRMEFRELIHHFACAHVGDAAEFDRGDQHTCPKCLMDSLVAGSDFEVIKSQYECTDCGYHGSEVEQVGTCLHCRLRFPFHLAEEEEVFGYDVDRLDILALLRAAN